MKNKRYFFAGVITIILSFILTAVLQNLLIGFIILFAGFMILVYWNIISYKWVCNKCKNATDMKVWQKFWGLNGFRHKRLYCPTCKEYNWGVEVPK